MNTTTTITVQQNKPHINQLLSTAAAGAGIIGDVDALLTPIQPKTLSTGGGGGGSGGNNNMNVRLTHSPNLEARPERNLWHIDEIMLMLNIMQNTGAVELLNDKSIKSDSIFLNVERLMQKNGYRRKSFIQIRTKWKFLKSTYNTTRRNGVVPKMIAPQIYQQLHKMLSGTGSVGSARSTTSSDCGNSRDGELIISGVEGGYASNDIPVSEETSSTTMEVADETNSFEHPIFGFRLGLVKQEPTDAGYETNTENSAQTNSINCADEKEQDPLAHLGGSTADSSSAISTAQIQFRTEIKEEPEELIDSAPIIDRQLASSSKNREPMPPLRVAPFAKESGNEFDQRMLDRPPPPLSMHPSNATRSQKPLNRVNLNEHAKTTMRRLPSQSRIVNETSLKFPPIHLSDEITLQPRVSSTDQPKTIVSTRKLRSNMPPPTYNNNNSSNKHISNSTNGNDLYVTAVQLSTSRQASSTPFSLLNQQPSAPPSTTNARKRRLDINWQDVSAKQYRIDNSQNSMSSRTTANTNNMHNKNTYHQSSQQQQQLLLKHQADAKMLETDFFDIALKNLGTSLRQMQREMLAEFFANQMDLARKEHEFQMQQDLLLMQAFSEQTRQLMQSASELLNFEDSVSQTEEEDTKVVVPDEDSDSSSGGGGDVDDHYDVGNINDEFERTQKSVTKDNIAKHNDEQQSTSAIIKQKDTNSPSHKHPKVSPRAEQLRANSISINTPRDEDESEDEICVYYQENNNHIINEGRERNDDIENNENNCDNENDEPSDDEDTAENHVADRTIEDAESEQASYTDAQLEETYEVEASRSYGDSDMHEFHMQREQEQSDSAEDHEDGEDMEDGENNVDEYA